MHGGVFTGQTHHSSGRELVSSWRGETDSQTDIDGHGLYVCACSECSVRLDVRLDVRLCVCPIVSAERYHMCLVLVMKKISPTFSSKLDGRKPTHLGKSPSHSKHFEQNRQFSVFSYDETVDKHSVLHISKVQNAIKPTNLQHCRISKKFRGVTSPNRRPLFKGKGRGRKAKGRE